ncbi:MAG: lysozyme inhibitor LprI family protein [Deltaproteobacteria bacterium]|nr:lysozyme inhibitor LprI family protein [Deltaproteobacteria bacterium]
MRKIFFLALMLCGQPLFAAEDFCATGKTHPIDVWFEKVMAQAEGVTFDIRNVQGEAYSRWDKELNRVYTELMNKLDNNEDKKKLREAQRAWIKFRDAEVELLWAEALYGGIGGTLAPVAVSDMGRKIVRERVCTLLKYQMMANH